MLWLAWASSRVSRVTRGWLDDPTASALAPSSAPMAASCTSPSSSSSLALALASSCSSAWLLCLSLSSSRATPSLVRRLAPARAASRCARLATVSASCTRCLQNRRHISRTARVVSCMVAKTDFFAKSVVLSLDLRSVPSESEGSVEVNRVAMFPTNCRTSSADTTSPDKSGERGCNTIFCSRPLCSRTFPKRTWGRLGEACLLGEDRDRDLETAACSAFEGLRWCLSINSSRCTD